MGIERFDNKLEIMLSSVFMAVSKVLKLLLRKPISETKHAYIATG